MNKYILLAGTALFLSAPAISHAQVTTDELNTRLTAAEGEIDSLTADLKRANTTIGENTSAITDLTTNLAGKANAADVYTKTEADGKFLTQSDASSTYATNEKVSSLETSLESNASAIEELQGNIKDVSDSVTALDNKLSGQINDITKEGGTIDTAVSSAKDELNDTINTTKSELQSNIDEVSGNVADLNEELTNVKSDLEGSISGNLTASKEYTDKAKAELETNIKDTKTELQDSIATNTDAILSNAEKIGGLTSELENANDAIDANTSAIADLESTKADKTDLEAVEQGIFDKVYTKEDVYTKQEVDSTFVTNETLDSTIQNTVGDLSQLGTGNKNHTNGTDNAPETIVEAIQNIDQSLGTIHGLADKLGDRHQGNLAQGTTVEEHLTSLDSAIGNRDKYTNANGSNNYLATAGADISSAISEIASNIGTAEDLGAEQNKVSAGNTVNQNIAAINSAIGNTSKLANTHYISGATNLTDAVAGLDSQIHNLDSRYYQLSSDIDDLRDDFNAGMATMSALTALVPNARATGNTQLSFGTGMYEGEAAMALGGFHWVDDNILLNVGAAWGSADTAYRMGVTYSW